MGYTHYWRQKRNASQTEWGKLARAVKKLLKHLPQTSSSAGGYYRDYPLRLAGGLGTDKPEVTPEWIWLNGIDDSNRLSHETFTLTRDRDDEVTGGTFNFCKTERKPYDLVVCGVLLLANDLLPEVWSISSDGRSNDWESARQLLHAVFGRPFALPIAIER